MKNGLSRSRLLLLFGVLLTILLGVTFLKLNSHVDAQGCAPELGIAQLELDYKESKKTDRYGNQFRYRAKVRDAKGEQVGRWAWDVFLTSQ